MQLRRIDGRRMEGVAPSGVIKREGMFGSQAVNVGRGARGFMLQTHKEETEPNKMVRQFSSFIMFE